MEHQATGLRRGARRFVLAATAVAAVALAAPLTTVFAGSNGQQIAVYEDISVSSVCISGYNQSAVWTSRCFNTPASRYGTNYGDLTGWWWKGPVYIDDYNPSYVATATCTVPTYQAGSDWWTCSS